MSRIVFLHPDLGIGGAERAVIDIALALKSSGHCVSFVTAHHDQSHCFPETKDGTLSVTTVGDWLPRSVLGRCHAVCAYVRMIVAALYLVLFMNEKQDYVFCDQISACIPVLRLFKQKVIFYCHFPDQLLTTRESWLKRLYRYPIDRLEEKSTGLAFHVLVNSYFTADVFRTTFTSLTHIQPEVLYPIPDFSAFDRAVSSPNDTCDVNIPTSATTVFLSLNRYTRAKNHALAIHALGELVKDPDIDSHGVHLVIAGGYDTRVRENIETFDKLNQLTSDLGLTDHVTFVRSCPEETKIWLLQRCTCLLYTPEREHFGIVPIEAMYMRRAVIAVDSGGPCETVSHGYTGFLCQPDPVKFGRMMAMVVGEPGLAEGMGEAGRERVMLRFSRDAFTIQLRDMMFDLNSERCMRRAHVQQKDS